MQAKRPLAEITGQPERAFSMWTMRADVACRPLPHGHPHILRVHALERQQLEVVREGEFRDLPGADAYALPGGRRLPGLRKTVELAPQDSVRLQDAPRFGQIRENQLRVGDVLKNRVGVDVVERFPGVAG
jgi:hypothetical protein